MYNLELKRAKELILKNKAETVIIQLPDGLKPKSKEITDFLQKETSATILIWAGTCFGACDTPNFKADMMIAFGHSEWN